MGPEGKQVAAFPGAAFLADIVGYAYKHGRRPSEVYDDYLAHPKDYRLLFAYGAVEADEQEKAMERAEQEAKSKAKRRAR